MPRQSEETEPRPGMWFFSTLITLELAISDGSASSRRDDPALLHIEIKRGAPPFFRPLLEGVVLLEVVEVVSPALNRAPHLRGEKHSLR